MEMLTCGSVLGLKDPGRAVLFISWVMLPRHIHKHLPLVLQHQQVPET